MNSSRPRVLILGSYPAVNPRHGGQIRLSEIIAAHRAAGHEVISVNCFPASAFYLDGPRGPHDFAVPPHFLAQYRGLKAPFIEDLACGDWVATDVRSMVRIEKLLEQGLDLIQIEQPWMLPVAKRLIDARQKSCLLVYGSANIETPLKLGIFEQYGVDGMDEILAAVHALEQAATASADLVVAVTQQDADILQPWARSGVPVVIAANGIRPWAADSSRIIQWRSRLGDQPFALYAASGHPPNIKGFCDAFGESMAGLAPDQRVVLVGGVSDQLEEHPWFARWASLHARRVIRLGVLPQADLDALRELAHTYILPITSGGGSNLKTAEALFSGRRVVATPMAMRGFESFSDLPGVEVVAPGPDFGRAVGRSLRAALPNQDFESTARRHTLTWSHTLTAMMSAITEKLSRP